MPHNLPPGRLLDLSPVGAPSWALIVRAVPVERHLTAGKTRRAGGSAEAWLWRIGQPCAGFPMCPADKDRPPQGRYPAKRRARMVTVGRCEF